MRRLLLAKAGIAVGLLCALLGRADAGLVQMPISTGGPAPPSGGAAPVLSGTATVGSTLTCTSGGGWTGAGTITYQQQFFSNTTSVAGPAASPPPTTYVVASGDAGKTITCKEIATNTPPGGSTTSAASNGIAIPAASGPTGTCSQSTAFFARVWALPATLDGTVGGTAGPTNHLAAYDNMICGLVTDGVWATLDALWVPATNTATGSNQAVANLNLVSSSYTLVLHGAPPFTANTGYAPGGAEGNTTTWIDTGYVPGTNGVNYTLNSAMMLSWTFTNVKSTAYGNIIGTYNSSTTVGSLISPWNTINYTTADNNANLNAASKVAATASNGSIVANRYANNYSPIFINGAFITDTSNSSVTVTPLSAYSVYLLSANDSNVSTGAGPWQIAVAGVGGKLNAQTPAPAVSSTGDSNITSTGLVPRICAYLTAVHGSC